MGAVRIRKAKKEDIPAIAVLSYSLFKKFEEFNPKDKIVKGYFGSKKHHNELLKEMNRRNGRYFVAEIDKKVVGFISVSIYDNWSMFKTRKKGRFEVIVVHPSQQKKGIGKLLMDHAYKWFRQNKVKQFSVTTHAADAGANAFWQHRGFKQSSVGYEK